MMRRPDAIARGVWSNRSLISDRPPASQPLTLTTPSISDVQGARMPESGRWALPAGWTDRRVAGAVFISLMLAYNANGREIGSYDSRPTAFAARELLLRGTLALNHVVGATPEYATRWGFILARDGRYRSIYSPAPALLTAAFTWPFWRAGVIDISAPLAPSLMA